MPICNPSVDGHFFFYCTPKQSKLSCSVLKHQPESRLLVWEALRACKRRAGGAFLEEMMGGKLVGDEDIGIATCEGSFNGRPFGLTACDQDTLALGFELIELDTIGSII